MFKKILLGAFLTIFGANLAFAAVQDGASFQSQLLDKSPTYWLIELGKDGVNTNTSYSGSIEVVGGKVTIAKEILIDSNETLTSEKGEIGIPSNKLYFNFSTPFYKGLILKVFPDPDFIAGGSDVKGAGKIIFREKVNGVYRTVLEFPFVEFLNTGMLTGGDFVVHSVYFDKMADLDQRNESFKTRLAIASDLQNVLRWARLAVLDGKISSDLYGKFDKLAESAWQLDTSKKAYFDWRYAQLKRAFNDGKASPELFYGGLLRLMNYLST